jgi:hypothetical protein
MSAAKRFRFDKFLISFDDLYAAPDDSFSDLVFSQINYFSVLTELCKASAVGKYFSVTGVYI